MPSWNNLHLENSFFVVVLRLAASVPRNRARTTSNATLPVLRRPTNQYNNPGGDKTCESASICCRNLGKK